MIFNLSIYAPPASEPEKVTLTLTGEGEKTNCYIEIDGEKYYTAQTIQVAKGTNVYCHAEHRSSPYIYYNGDTVGSYTPTDILNGQYYELREYTYVCNNNSNIFLEYSIEEAAITITEQ